MIAVNIILIIIFSYLVFCTLYNLVFSVAAIVCRPARYDRVEIKNRFAIFIPAYKEDLIVLHTVRWALKQEYPSDKFDVVVIADQLRKETLSELSQLPIKLIPVFFKQSTKARSIKFALEQLPEDEYECILILDADNLLGDMCLEKANHAYVQGFKMVQLHRTAKNKNTTTAILDAISEEIGNTIHRKGHRALGLSSTLIGSGMVFDYNIFKDVMLSLDIEDNPAEDRGINAEMLNRGLICEYIDSAYVFDEKVQSNQVLERQRVRWISAQLTYIREFWIKQPLKTMTTSPNYFDYALQTLILPRSLLIVANFLGLLFSVISLTMRLSFFPGVICWSMLLVGCILCFALSIGKEITRKELRRALLYFPVTFFSIVKALFRSSSSSKEFIHTPKEYTGDRSASVPKN